MAGDVVEAAGSVVGSTDATTSKGKQGCVIQPHDGVQSLLDDVLELRNLYASNHLSDVLLVFPSEKSATSASARAEEEDDAARPEQHLLPAHRLVLSLRSGAFHSALLHSKSSQVPSQVRFPIKIIVEDTSYTVFATLLKFIYTNEVTIDPINEDEPNRNKKDEREQFWKDLLRAAFVYLVPSLVDIGVQQLTRVVLGKVGDCGCEGEPTAPTDLKQLRKVLDILVFSDGVVASKPNATHQRTSARAPAGVENGETPGKSSNDEVKSGTAPGVGRCMAGIAQLQQLCMSKLEDVPDVHFEALVHSESGKRCSTDRLCDILKKRSRVPLVAAVRYQLGRVVNEMLRLGESLEKTDEIEKDLPLVAALKTGNDSIIRRLLVDADSSYFLLTDKIPVFFLGCASGNLVHCQILIEHNPSDVNLISPLEDGDKEILAEYGRRQTPLHIASRRGHAQIVDMLLNHTAASNLQDEEGNTALHRAPNIETAQVLLSSAFRTNPNIPNRRGQTPLHVAAANGNVGVIDLLIHNGADQDILDDQGQNSFHVAAANGHTSVALVLLHENDNRSQQIQQRLRQKGAASDKTHAGNGQDSEASTDGNGDPSEDESKPLFDINQEDLKGNTALHLAAMSPSDRCQKMLQLLLENGADPNRSNWFGYSPLHLFCSHQSGPSSVVDVFIEHGANIHTQSLDGSTPLHLAVGRASEEVAVQLVIAGAHVHLQDAAGRSVVDLAETTNQGVMLVPVLRNLAQPPEWVPDEQAAECSSCRAVFRVAMRKHHCRHCGRIICYNCSSNKIAIPKFHLAKPSRVCDTCYDVLSFRRLL